MAKKSRLSNPEYAKAVAEAYVNGLSREEMADIFCVHKDTITIWTRDPRVLAHAGKLAQERVIRIVRRIDTAMEEKMDEITEDPELMLKVRKEYLARTGGLEQAGVTSETVGDTVKALEENPGLADAIKKILEGDEASAGGS